MVLKILRRLAHTGLCFIIFCITVNSLFAQRTIVTIGDSNGAAAFGWVNQLKVIRPQDSIFNYSIGGNTIGFDNLEREELNALKNIDQNLVNARKRSDSGVLDDVIIMLGTNDCKLVFDGRRDEILGNLENLIKRIKAFQPEESMNIYIVTPPPIGPDSILLEKYQGGDTRVQALLPGYLDIALKTGSAFVNIYQELKPDFENLNTDGIHLNEKGSKLVARALNPFLDKMSKIRWDDTEKWQWPNAAKVVEIVSPLDGEKQKAYFYSTTDDKPRPLIVSLHTWSGDYSQKDQLVTQIIDKNWNYIHPDFRGVNNSPKAMGSPYAISDIDEAISWALENANVEPGQIHIIGTSGGGYATLCMYMQSKHPVKSFSAWVPISDIEAWYYESLGRKNKYAGDILSATGSVDSVLNAEEARRRSPLSMATPVMARKGSQLSIFAGVHDGYTGSVPITHSLNFYNKVLAEMGAPAMSLISERKIRELLAMRTHPELPGQKIGGRDVIFLSEYNNVSIVIFEGTHEMLTDVALQLPGKYVD